MNRNELNSAATMKSITDAFFNRFQQGGFDAINLSDICEECHVSRTTFYRYFNDKYDILEKKEEFLLNETAAFTKKQLSDEEIITILNFIKENLYYYRVIMTSDLSRRFMAKWSNQIFEGFRKRLKEKKLEADDLQVRVISAGFLAGLSYWIEREPNIDLDYFVNLYKTAC